MTSTAPRFVFLSGSLSSGSRADRIARWCAEQGDDVTVFLGQDLAFPFYRPKRSDRHDLLLSVAHIRRVVPDVAA
jgi:FMN reductase